MMKTIGTVAAIGTILLGSVASAAPDVPGNKATKAVLPTGSKGIDGNLFGVGDSDWYKVRLERDYTYGIQVWTACSYTAISLLDRHGHTLKTASGDYEFIGFISHYTNYSGLYYVAVQSTGIFPDCTQSPASYSGSFSLVAVRECGEDARTRCTLPVGGSIASRIARWDDEDWFKVDVPAQGTYTFRISAPSGLGGFIYTPRLSLRRADSSVIADSDRPSAYSCPRGADNGPCLRAPLEAGHYYAAVRSPNGDASYQLSAQAGR